MDGIRTFTVVPALPKPIARLRELAYNMWWCWNPDGYDLFRRLDFDLWEEVEHNPVRLLSAISQARLEQAANDRAFLAQMDRVLDGLYVYMSQRTWFNEHHKELCEKTIAYFSMEFGLHEALPIYAGGLGVLAGDHLKSASDLGLPLVGVGLLYRQGYFHQYLTSDGWQLEDYPNYEFHQFPITPARDAEGEPIRIEVEIRGRPVLAQIWLCQVGRIPLYLLDSDIPENRAEDRQITNQLYGGDKENRIRQEVMLGVGGVRALDALGIEPDACHMNEGHSAFLALERIVMLMEQRGLTFSEAREAVTASNVFTTHTPVPAGIDTFAPHLVDTYMGHYATKMGISRQDFLGLGRIDPGNNNEPFCMAILALRLAAGVNGVSRLHGGVSRDMWKRVWPNVPTNEVPIGSVTNGVHVRSWLSLDMAQLFDRYLGPDWADDPVDRGVWERVDEIPDAELWRTHERRRERLVAVTRQMIREQYRRRGAPPVELKFAEEVLDPDSLTVGFARRFAPYKRATLIFRDVERITQILTNPERPAQIIFAGKAHPNDDLGKELIKQVIQIARRPELRRKIVFIEDYDINFARYLVQGVDVWLNTPTPLHEASGTSGMKVPPNGGINLSCMDGWWPEAYDGENGWSIGDGRVYPDQGYQDHVEAESLYDLLEKEIIPLFYDRTADGLPRRWLARMKASMRTIPPAFNTNRMVADYVAQFYVQACGRWEHLTTDEFAASRKLAQWRQEMIRRWSQIRVMSVQATEEKELAVGDELDVHARVHLGSISPDEVSVELFYGPVDPRGQIADGQAEQMQCQGEASTDGTFLYAGALPCRSSGQYGYSVRIVPDNQDLANRYAAGLIVWG
jgi:glycogen phosphorylase